MSQLVVAAWKGAPPLTSLATSSHGLEKLRNGTTPPAFLPERTLPHKAGCWGQLLPDFLRLLVYAPNPGAVSQGRSGRPQPLSVLSTCCLPSAPVITI